MNIYQKLSSVKNMSVFGKFNLFLIVVSIIILFSLLHITKLRTETKQVNMRDQLVNKLMVYSQQIGLYSELVLREAAEAKIELEKAVSLYEKYLYTLRNGGSFFLSEQERRTIKSASSQAKPYIANIEKRWSEIKESAEIIIAHETFVGGTEMATGSFDAFGNYNEIQVFKPIAPEVKSALKNIESHISTFEILNSELVKFYVAEKKRLDDRITLVLFVYITIFFSVIGLGIFIFRYTLVKKLEDLVHYSKEISSGNLQENIDFDRNDELGQIAKSLENLKQHLRNAIVFINKIGNGELKAEFTIQGDEDELGKSLNLMKETMLSASEDEQQRKRDDEIRNWATQGIAKFGELLRLNTNDLNELSYNILSNLIEYVNADLGGVYIITETDGKKFIDLVAAYAYDRRKYLSKRLDWGESLVGRSVQEQKTIFLTEIPEDYINVSSGLGYAHPSCLVLTPLINNDTIFGVIELAALNELETHHIEFIEKISESIASTIATVKINMTTSRLLSESSEQAERLAQQEEEMRQNMEEMQATQEEAAIRTKEMEGILIALNNSIGSYELNLNGNIIEVNDVFRTTLGFNRDEIIGLSHKELVLNSFESEKQYNELWQQIIEGKTIKRDVVVDTLDSKLFLTEVYNAVYDTYGDMYKVFVLVNDHSEERRVQAELNDKLKEIEDAKSALQEKEINQREEIEKLRAESDQQIEEIKTAEEAVNVERQASLEMVMAKEFELQVEIDKLRKENDLLKQQGSNVASEPSETYPDILIDWDDSYSVKYEEIDTQHKELIKLINKFFDAFKHGKAEKEIKQILKDLISYTNYHFKTEERYFTEHNYSETDSHVVEHRKLVDQIVDFQKQLESGKVTLSYEILTFLRDWIVKHILDTDMKYVGKLGDAAEKTTENAPIGNTLIEWDDSYNLDIQAIDDQHKILVDLINQFYVAFKSGRAKKQVKTILKGLADYTEYHFGVEEKYFKKFKYENEKEHLALHKEFVTKISNFQDEYNAGKINISYELMNFLRDWLVNHILKEDRKYISLFKDKGVK